MKNILVTGGMGFICTNFIKYLFNNPEFTGKIVNLDKLTYAAQPDNLKDVQDFYSDEDYVFVKGDINDRDLVEHTLYTHKIDVVVNFAAESSVDKSLLGADDFLNSNIIGVYNLLEACKTIWNEQGGFENKLFIQVSTDECFVQENLESFATEESAYNPHNMYAATKASANHIAMSYYHTYNLPIILTYMSNNYGLYQHNEKFIPTIINNIINGKEIPVYGNGTNRRQWLFVEDACDAFWKIIDKGTPGESYNISDDNEMDNVNIVQTICDIYDELYPVTDMPPYNKGMHEIRFVKDRVGHDFRYNINYDKIKKLGWSPKTKLKDGLIKTIKWYVENK